MFLKNIWGNIPNTVSATSAPTNTRRHHGNGFSTKITIVGLVGICLIALGALVACPTEDDGDDGGPTASFAAATSAITEGASDTIGVALSADAGADGVAVQFGVVPDGTTAGDDDWQITPGGSSGVEAVVGSANTWRVTIPSGMRSAPITVTAPADADVDGGVVIFELQSGTGYGIGSANRHTLTINDAGVPTASFAAATSDIREGASDTINVALSADAGANGIAVQFGVVSDDTTAGDDDWQITTGGSSGVEAVAGSDEIWRVTIPSGMRSASITVTAPDDDDGDGGVVVFELQSGTGYGIGSTNRHMLTITDNDAPPAFSAASYSFDIGEGDYSESSPGAVGTVSATNATRYAITEGDADMRFAIDGNGAITAIGALDFETLTDRGDGTRGYTLTVTAHNGDGDDAPTATATVTITLNDLLPGLVPVSYTIEVGEDGMFGSLNGVSASGTTLNLGAIATVDDFDPTTFTITPAAPFTLTKEARLTSDAMLMATAADLDFEATGSYELTVSATGTVGNPPTAPPTQNDNTITLNVTVTDVAYVTADDLTVRDDATTLALMLSAVDGTTAYTLAGIRSVDTPNTPFSVATAGDNQLTVDPDQLDVEDAAKPNSYSDVVITIEINGGGLNDDVETITVGTITVTGVPGFLDTQPTLSLREDGLFMEVGDTTLATPSNTIDLVGTSEYTFVKGGFVPSGVTLDSVDPASGMPSFSIAGTTLTVANPENLDFEDGDKDSFALTITDGIDSSATTTLTVEIADLQDGSADEPYMIDSVTQLQSIDTVFVNDYTTDNGITLDRDQSLAAHYLLTANLDLTGHDPDGDGSGFDPIGDCGGDNTCRTDGDNDFTGGFDGDGYTIANLTINRSSLEGVGLFAYADGAIIRNVVLTGVNVRGNNSTGGLIGSINRSTTGRIVEHSGVSGSVEGAVNVGLLIGQASGIISNSFAIGMVDGISSIGVLIGGHSGRLTANAYAVGMVNGISSRIGALIGNKESSDMVNGYTSASLTGGPDIITGNIDLGAIAGQSFSGTLQNNYWNSDPAQINGNSTSITTDDMPQSPKRGVGDESADPAGVTAKTGAELMALNEMAIADDATNGSNWRVQFDIDNADNDNNPTTGTTDIESVRCDVDGDGTVGATEWLWDFGTTSEYPVLNCMSLTPAQQRALIDLFPPTL